MYCYSMSRRKEYTAEEAASVIDGLMAGKTFRGVAAECGMSLGMVQRILAAYYSPAPFIPDGGR